jgi:uncharacterized membrane protein YbhN (UPF0104 family)
MNRDAVLRFLRRAVPTVFYVLLAVFLVFYLVSIDWGTIGRLRPEPLWLIVATVVMVVSLYGFVGVWVAILRSIGAGIRWSRALNLVYATAWLGRYIPGKVPYILGKIYFASKQGIPRAKLAASSLLEAVFQIVAQLLVGLGLLALDRRTDVIGPWMTIAMLVVLALCVVAVIPPVFNRLFCLAARILRRDIGDGHDISWRTVLTGVGLYLPAIFANGTGTYFVARALDPGLGPELVLFITGAAILSGVVGMLAVFAPSGLGVREGVMLLLLGLVTDPATAVAVTVVSRLWSVIADALFVGTAWLADRILTRLGR